MKTNKIIFGTIFVLLIFVLVIVGTYAVISMIPEKDSEGNTVYKYYQECQATITEELIGSDVHIKTAQCTKLDKCNGLFSLNPYALFRTSGVIKMYDSKGTLATKEYTTSLFGGEARVTLKGCTSDTDIVLRLYDEEGQLMDTYPK